MIRRSSMRLLAMGLIAAVLLLSPVLVAAQSFDQFHPDQYGRRMGFDRYEKGYKADAVKFFLRGARFADKTCQISLALLTWNGDGVERDRPKAYVWADIASERGYPDFVVMRERMWEEMTPEEQARALEIGPDLYAEYGDAVAKKRLERLLSQGSRNRIGSRTGSKTAGGGAIQMDSSSRAAFLTALQQTPGLQENMSNPVSKDAKWNMMFNALKGAIGSVKGAQALSYYGPENWEPRYYWRAQDALWVPDGRVTVGELEKAKGRIKR